MSKSCVLCDKVAEKQLTWVNCSGSGIGGGLQGGPMCFSCMDFMNDALSRFPTASQTLTIWPLDKDLGLK